MGISSAQIDDTALRARLEIKLPSGRKQAPRGCRFDAQSGTLSVRGNVSTGLGLQLPERVEMKALPYLGLPTGIEAFDSSLETCFSRRSKNGGDAQAQTQPDHPSQGVAELVSTLETSVVIELGIGWQTEELPVLDHGLHCRAGKDSAIGPRSNQTSVQRDGVENFHVDSTFDDQPSITSKLSSS
jgi:hypothetical protein